MRRAQNIAIGVISAIVVLAILSVFRHFALGWLGAIINTFLQLAVLVVAVVVGIRVYGYAQHPAAGQDDQALAEREALVESGQADWCPVCEGAGSVSRRRESSQGLFNFQCERCEGSGLVPK